MRFFMHREVGPESPGPIGDHCHVDFRIVTCQLDEMLKRLRGVFSRDSIPEELAGCVGLHDSSGSPLMLHEDSSYGSGHGSVREDSCIDGIHVKVIADYQETS